MPWTHRGRTLALLTAVAALSLAPAGATTAATHASGTPAAVPAASATAWVRAAHLVPELGEMTIALVPFSGSASGDVPSGDIPSATEANGAKVVAPSAGYGTVGDYRQVPAGRYAVTIRPAGSAPDSTPVLTGTFEAAGDAAYTLAAIGTLESPRIDAIRDSLAPPSAGTARVRLLPAVPDASALTVTAKNGPVLAEDAPFGRPTAYADVPAGRWVLDVTTTGTSRDASPVTATVDVASGGVYTVFVLADGDDGIRLEPVVDAQGMGSAPGGGVQTGLGGLAERPLDLRFVGGLTLTATGALGFLLVGRRPGRVRVKG